MKLRLAAALVVALHATGSVACSSSASTSGSGASATIPLLKVGSPAGISTLDPLTTQGCDTDYCGLFMERLLKFGPNGKLEPELATSVTQPNRATYVYHLRHGVKFWDGNELTSADVVNSLDYQRSPGSQTVIHYTNVKSIEATDRYTATVTLLHPDAGWPDTVAYAGVIFEKSFQDAHKATMGNPATLIQGTGPWKIDRFDPGTGIELSANPKWWGGKVPVQHISFKFFADEKSEALAMRAGEIEVAFPQDGRTFAATSGAKLNSYLINTVGFFGMNTKLAPWSDVHVRRAVAYALNRTDIIAANGGPASASPVYTLLPEFDLRTLGSKSQVDALLKSIPRYQYSPVKAKQEMAQSGYPHGFTASLDIFSNGSIPNIAQVIAAELQQIGITLELNVMPSAKWVTEIYGPKTFGPMFTTIHSSSADPGAIPGYMLGTERAGPGGLNFANYTPAQVDDMLAAGMAATDPAKRLAVYGQLLAKVAADVPYVPLYQANAYVATSSKYALPGFDVNAYEIPWALNIKRTA